MSEDFLASIFCEDFSSECFFSEYFFGEYLKKKSSQKSAFLANKHKVNIN
jgi:hypothetical protein